MTHPAVRVMAEGRPAEIGLFTWLHLMVEEAMPDVEEVEWNTEAEDLGAIITGADDVVLRVRAERREVALVRMGGCLVHANLLVKRAGFLVAGPSPAVVAAAIEQIRELVPEHVAEERLGYVGLRISYLADHGIASSLTRDIKVPSWEGIAGNYSAPTRTALDRLVRGMEPGKAGQLILWHGAPGTGKTYAIRSLAWEWRSWADFHYITDPEVLFGSNPQYLLAVLLEAQEDRSTADEVPERWTVLVLEDMGEILAPDARMQMGQGLSRLLNLVDGLLGQGLRLLVLVTTNELLARVHPAVARPGRCAAEVDFEELEPEEVRAWFASRGAGVPPELAGERATISVLHAALDGRPAERPKAVGFIR